MKKKNQTYKDYLSNLLSFIESKDEVPPYNVDKILTEAGYKPDEEGKKFQAVANKSAANSPHNWRNRARNAHEGAKASYLKKISVAKTHRLRSELIDAINTLLSQQNLKIAFAHRNFSDQTDEDLESLLDQLEYIASQKDKDSNE